MGKKCGKTTDNKGRLVSFSSDSIVFPLLRILIIPFTRQEAIYIYISMLPRVFIPVLMQPIYALSGFKPNAFAYLSSASY